MFHVQTYIYFPADENPSFPIKMPVDDTDTLRKAEPYLDFRRLEGYIELSYHEQPILTKEYWDFIIDYWDYLFQAIRSFLKKGSGRMYLPDQPTPIAFQEQGPNRVLLTVGEGGEYGKWLLPKEELIKALLDGMARFYKGLSDAFSDSIVQKHLFRDKYEHLLKFKKHYFGE